MDEQMRERTEDMAYLLWVQGRLDLLVADGLLDGCPRLTPEGQKEFASMETAGFKPTGEDKVLWALQNNPQIPKDKETLRAILTLVLKYRPGTGPGTVDDLPK